MKNVCYVNENNLGFCAYYIQVTWLFCEIVWCWAIEIVVSFSVLNTKSLRSYDTLENLWV